MTDHKRPRRTPAASEQVTEKLNAVYGDESPGSALDEVLERLQFLSLPADDLWN